MGEREITDWLRRHDPAASIPDGGFSPRRARGVVRTMSHPLLGWLWLHHKAVSRCLAIIALAAALCFLFSIRPRSKRTLPPVAVLAAPAALAPEPHVHDAQDAPPDDLPPPPSLDFPEEIAP